MSEYRIKSAWVQSCNGHACRDEYRHIAEVRRKFLWFEYWALLPTSEWRNSVALAQHDITSHIHRQNTDVKYTYINEADL